MLICTPYTSGTREGADLPQSATSKLSLLYYPVKTPPALNLTWYPAIWPLSTHKSSKLPTSSHSLTKFIEKFLAQSSVFHQKPLKAIPVSTQLSFLVSLFFFNLILEFNIASYSHAQTRTLSKQGHYLHYSQYTCARIPWLLPIFSLPPQSWFPCLFS